MASLGGVDLPCSNTVHCEVTKNKRTLFRLDIEVWVHNLVEMTAAHELLTHSMVLQVSHSKGYSMRSNCRETTKRRKARCHRPMDWSQVRRLASTPQHTAVPLSSTSTTIILVSIQPTTNNRPFVPTGCPLSYLFQLELRAVLSQSQHHTN